MSSVTEPLVAERAVLGAVLPEGASEETPLLLAGDRDSSPTPPPPPPPPNKSRVNVKFVLFLICLLVVFADLGDFIALPAQTKLFEDIICRDYYVGLNATAFSSATTTTTAAGRGSAEVWSAHDNESRCKAEPVQSELALVLGWKQTFEQVPGLALALPFGVIADRWGRKPVLLLALAGNLLSETWVRVVCWWSDIFPLRFIWLASAIQLVGGGSQVATSMLFVIVADIAPETERMNFLSIVFTAVLLSEICAVPIGAALTEIDPWIPLLLSWLLILLGSFLAFAFPETLSPSKGVYASTGNGNHDENSLSPETRFPAELKSRLVHEMDKLHQAIGFIFSDRNVLLLVLTFFVALLSRQSMQFLIIYASRQYGWSIAQASYLYTLRSVLNLVLLLAILPSISWLLTKKLNFFTNAKDLVLSQGQALLMIVGMLIISFAEARWFFIFGLAVLALGSAFALTDRSLVTSLVDAHHFATLYATISIVQAVGMIVAGPMLAATMHWGLVLGPPWTGLPFLFAAGLFMLALIGISFVRLAKPADVEDGEGSEQRGG